MGIALYQAGGFVSAKAEINPRPVEDAVEGGVSFSFPARYRVGEAIALGLEPAIASGGDRQWSVCNKDPGREDERQH